jgi:hypothetical protein
MADELAGAAPAQAPAPTPAPAPVSAERAAADAGDFGAFDRAHVAKREGKTVPQPAEPARAQAASPAPTGEAPAVDPAASAQPVSNRQQKINEYERRIAEQEQRIRALEASRSPTPQGPAPNGQPPTSAPAQPPPASQKERVARYLALPDAPKVDDFDTYPEFNAAQTLFLQDKLGEEQATVQRQRDAQTQRLHALASRDDAFRERLTAAKEADPAFVASLSDEAKSLGGIDHALRSGRQPGPVHIIGELVYDSPHAAAFLRHISADPQALSALVAPPAHLARVPPQWRAKAHIDHLVTEFRRLEGRLAYEASLTASDPAGSSAPPSSVSAAPPPPPTLGKAGRSTDPVRSALARNDFTAFDEAEMEKRRRQRTGGRAG